jgi:hypothetical protein
LSAVARRIVPADDTLPAVDMSKEGYALALAYSGDASWESIRLLREDIFRTLWGRR